MMDLDVHQTERFLHVENVLGGHLEEALTMPPQRPHRAYLVWWAEAPLEEPNGVEVLNPLAI